MKGKVGTQPAMKEMNSERPKLETKEKRRKAGRRTGKPSDSRQRQQGMVACMAR